MSLPRIVNFPKTQTLLALGVLAGCFWTKAFDWHDGLLMILTFYFTKHDPGKEP
ncbi:hypothetical protein [Caulobacter sp. CCG-8]|uniref:hypothetical protein n=1 Tax=Caulobacter sp. CCG-8 TaxID=3127958 RepID=UPI00307E60ED